MTFWRVDNAFGSFLPGDPASMGVQGNAYDLHHMLFNSANSSSKTSSRGQDSQNDGSQQERSALTSGRLFEAVASFKLIWSNNGMSSPKKLSIWRPMLSEGMFYFGDIALNGYNLYGQLLSSSNLTFFVICNLKLTFNVGMNHLIQLLSFVIPVKILFSEPQKVIMLLVELRSTGVQRAYHFGILKLHQVLLL